MGLKDFLRDIRLVITSPSQRFAVIHERGALWGSLALLIVPAYFGFTYAGAIYFDAEPLPGYAFVLPAVVAAGAQLVKVFLIHFFARLFRGRRRHSAGTASFRGLLTVFGYASVPSVLAMLLAASLFFALPEQVGGVMRDFRGIAIPVLVAAGIALFVWSVILVVLAMRVVYAIRDLKILGAFVLGSICMGLPAVAGSMVVDGARVDYDYVRPIVAERMTRFFSSDPLAETQRSTRISLSMDHLVYRLKQPGRFDLVIYAGTQLRERRSRRITLGVSRVFSSDRHVRILGRIVGLPGDEVAVEDGVLRINGQAWSEPYIGQEFRAEVSLQVRKLGPSEYLILPEDRRLVEEMEGDLVVKRERIRGRKLISKWPVGWFMYRPTVFLKAHPQ